MSVKPFLFAIIYFLFFCTIRLQFVLVFKRKVFSVETVSHTCDFKPTSTCYPPKSWLNLRFQWALRLYRVNSIIRSLSCTAFALSPGLMFCCSCPAQFCPCTFWWNQFSCALLYCFHPLTHPRVFVKLPVTAGEKIQITNQRTNPVAVCQHCLLRNGNCACWKGSWRDQILPGLSHSGLAWFWCCCFLKNTSDSAVAQRESICFKQGDFNCQGLTLPRDWSTAEQFSHLQLADCAIAFVLARR